MNIALITIMASILRKAHQKFHNEGFLPVIRSGFRLAVDYYNMVYHYKIRTILPTQEKIIKLNDIECPINISLFDNFIPLYSPPWPITDDPNYERVEIKAIRDYCNSGDNVVIIGGGLGATTIAATEEVGVCGSIIVFEGAEEAYHRTKETIRYHQVENQVNLRKAFVGRKAPTNFSIRRREKAKIINPDELPDADVYELDCEGAETTILSEMSTRPNVVLVETHDNHKIVVEILEDTGYEIIEVVDDAEGQHSDCTHIQATLSDQSE